ncbi:FAD-dependent oxidoreductase [Spongiactinospora sp. TRM90649]|uniref:NAD(P)/FAD-dependent oxidoreductase n=1 Tax=Spongiactinospora sp. TRM90649 TaxID=3031114 RepID=UPI0023F7FEC7|nr:FAD-dependent oxidoreductase [Spongiactinospora sp. TRM90649]MDF5755283.1 FAD-dependent oxidoreductase [Spongiactinospora sp. TRM90649]
MRTHIAIVGSGIVGAAAAYRLRKKGVAVTIVERADSRGQATAAGAGIICPWVDHDGDDAWYGFAREGARAYPTLLEELAGDGETDPGYARTGALLTADDAAGLDDVAALLRDRSPLAPEMGEVSVPDDPGGLFPPLTKDLAALFVGGAARVDGRGVRDAMLRAAAQRGAMLRTGTAGLDAKGRLSINGEPIGADAVILAAGAWTGELCAPLGHRLSVRPERGQIVHAELPGTDTSGWPIVLPRVGPYLLGFPGSRVVFGATCEEAGFDGRATVGGLSGLLSAGLTVAPGLASATALEIRVGFRPMTGDGRPMIGSLAPGVVVATGLSAYGLTTGPLAGCLAADLAIGEPTTIDLTPFTPLRETDPVS